MFRVRQGVLYIDIGIWDLCDDSKYQKQQLRIVVVMVVGMFVIFVQKDIGFLLVGYLLLVGRLGNGIFSQKYFRYFMYVRKFLVVGM